MSYTELLTIWTGATGLPGYTKTRYVGELTGGQLTSAGTNLRTFWDSIKALIPSIVTLTIQPTASFHEDNGDLIGESAIATPPTAVVGTGAGAYLAASGFLILWNTGVVNGGKKIRGRTYFVPMTANAAQSDGTIVEANRTVVQSAANALVLSTPAIGINSRARAGNPGAVDTTVLVISANVPDKQVVLRSRRD